MVYSAKVLARNSINEFLKANHKLRNEMLYHVKFMLVYHYDSMKAINTGFASRYVTAGEMFLRWIRINKWDIIESNPSMKPNQTKIRRQLP